MAISVISLGIFLALKTKRKETGEDVAYLSRHT